MMTAPAHAAPDETRSNRKSGELPSFAVPSLRFDNRTPFAAAQFDIVDQYDAPFHVIVGKIGYTIEACNADGWAALKVLDSPVPLNTEDRHDGDDPAASVLEESDFAPFKPRCDVIVNAVAHAPKNTRAKRFSVRLTVMPAPAANAKHAAIIDKALLVCGARWFVKKPAVGRLLQWPLKIVTLGLARPNPWRMSAPEPVTHLPLRYEYAFGGECRIDSDDRAARRVAAKHRTAGPPAGAPAPYAVAHEACDTNPLGRGFARNWFLKATKSKRLPAPQVSAEANPCKARNFLKVAGGETPEPPAGFGVIGRAWLPRRALIGNIEDKPNWHADDIARLPADFDFAYWNCAPQDQQCDYLNGQEQFTLVNLCSQDSPGARPDRHGNTVLRFALPQQAMLVLAANRAAQLTVLPLSLDTVIVNPESRRVDLVWRGCLPADGNNVESRLMHITEPEQLARLDMLVQRQWSETPPNDADGE